MLMLVLGSSFLVTFLGWEGVGLCSYLLVSFWFERNAAAVAGKKAFVTNRVGDVGFLLAMFLIFASYGSLDYAADARRARTVIDSGTATAIALLLLVAAVGKSAQIPLHLWLPDAMEGPTPVSALIHAATMVTAGVFLLCRAHVFLDVSRDAMTVVAWVGGITALLAGTVAILQPDIKRVLAYSTVSQLGYMFLAVGIHAYTAAVFMVLCHAFYKGCLFLGAGSVIHGNHDVQDMRVMGRFRKFMPLHRVGDGGRVARDRRRAAALGLLLEGRDHQPGVPARRLRPVGRRHRRRRRSPRCYMTRLIWLTFYGNARYETAALDGRRRIPVVSGGSGEDDAGDARRRSTPTPTTYADSDPSPTVSYGDPVADAGGPRAARVAADHDLPDHGARGARRDRRAHEPAVHEHRVARQVARVVVPRRARGAPRHLHRRLRPRDAHVRHRGRAASSSPTRSTRRASSTPTATR